MWFQRIFSPAKAQKVHSGLPGEQVNGLQVSARALIQLNRLRLNTSRYLPGHGVGSRTSVRRKPAADFREHRMYVPGDDMRFVDWKASARQEHIFIKQGEYQKKVNVYVLLDCSASMGWGEPPKAATALSLAAALGYSALTHGDRLTVVPLVDRNQLNGTAVRSMAPLGPISGKGQFPGLLNYFRSLPFQGSIDLAEAIRHFSRRVAVGSGLVLLISDLLGNEPYSRAEIGSALEYLPMPTWNVVVLHLLHPAELKPTWRGEYEFFDIETGTTTNYDVTAKVLQAYQGRVQAWREKLEFECNENNALYSLIQSGCALDTEIIPILRDLNVVVPL